MNENRMSWIMGGLDWDRLTSWEEKFVEACEEYFKKHSDLTKLLEEKLEEIYQKKSR